MKQMPQIQKVMTTMPHTIGKDIPLKSALAMMREHRIRHLPVQDAVKLMGILTDRDLKLAASFADPETLKVEDVMTPDPYTIAPETPMDRVVVEMAEHKYGCAVIQQGNGKIVGIFTAVDGLRVLAETLVTFYKPGSDQNTRRGA
jgi:acetoin utilization protein AcuB